MLSILITHYKTLPLLKLCLRSIRQHCNDIGAKEILVLDSEARPDTAEVLADQFPEVRYLGFRTNVGYGHLVNAGLRASRGEFVLISHPDIVFTEGAVATLMRALEQNLHAGIAAPQLLSFSGEVLKTCFRFYSFASILGRRTILKHSRRIRRATEHFLMADTAFDEDKVWPVGWVQGSCLMARRSAVAHVGMLDERFFMYFEDVDWCRRFWENGYHVVYVPAAKLFHWNIQSSRRFGGVLDFFLNAYTRIHIASAIKYFLKYGLRQPRFGL